MPYKDLNKKRIFWEKFNKEIRPSLNKKYYLSKKNDENFQKRLQRNRLKRGERKLNYNMYGMTQADYDRMLEKQNYVCAICHQKNKPNPKTNRTRKLAVDHCHKKNLIRGLLCNGCNTGIGQLKDSVDVLKSAIVYLIKNG